MVQQHQGQKNPRLVLQDDRNLVSYADDGAAWSTKTQTDAPPPPAPEEPAAAAAPDGEEAAPEPEAAPAEAPPPPEPAARTYTVESGDTMWAIAERFYGDESKHQVIADASGIPNPGQIRLGQVLTIP